MKNSKLVLYENTQANFRLSIETMYEKTKQDGSTQSAIYINTKNDSAIFKPSTFLVFTYLTDDYTTTKGVYTTVPHMYKIRMAFETMHQMLNTPEAFVDVNGALSVTADYAQPVVVDNINMKNADWLSLMLTTYNDGKSLGNRPAVAIQHSKSDGYSSMLTADEFESIYDLVAHIDFATLENQAVMIELISRSMGGATQQHRQTQFNNYVQSAQVAARVPVTQPQVQQRAQFQQPVVQQRAPQPQAHNQQVAQQYSQPQVQRQQPTTNPLPPRPAAPKITMDAVKDIEVEDISLDDENEVNSIFEEME